MSKDAISRLFIHCVNQAGFDAKDVQYDFSFCQGSGCSFTGEANIDAELDTCIGVQLTVDTERAIALKKAHEDQRFTARVERGRGGNYAHSNTVSGVCEFEADGSDDADQEFEKFLEVLAEEIETSVEERKERVCGEFQRLIEPLLLCQVSEPTEIFREKVGCEVVALVLKAPCSSADILDNYMDGEEGPDDALELLEEIQLSAWKAIQIGDVALVVIDEDGEEEEIDTCGCVIYDRREPISDVPLFDELRSLVEEKQKQLSAQNIELPLAA